MLRNIPIYAKLFFLYAKFSYVKGKIEMSDMRVRRIDNELGVVDLAYRAGHLTGAQSEVYEKLKASREELENNRLKIKNAIRTITELFSNVVKHETSPPRSATYLLHLFLTKSDRQAIPGDLDEEFVVEILPRFGARRAIFWYWTQTIMTIAIRNPVCKWLLLGTSMAKLSDWVWKRIGG